MILALSAVTSLFCADAGALRQARVVRWLDRLTGGVFLGFGVRLALDRR